MSVRVLVLLCLVTTPLTEGASVRDATQLRSAAAAAAGRRGLLLALANEEKYLAVGGYEDEAACTAGGAIHNRSVVMAYKAGCRTSGVNISLAVQCNGTMVTFKYYTNSSSCTGEATEGVFPSTCVHAGGGFGSMIIPNSILSNASTDDDDLDHFVRFYCADGPIANVVGDRHLQLYSDDSCAVENTYSDGMPAAVSVTGWDQAVGICKAHPPRLQRFLVASGMPGLVSGMADKVNVDCDQNTMSVISYNHADCYDNGTGGLSSTYTFEPINGCKAMAGQSARFVGTATCESDDDGTGTSWSGGIGVTSTADHARKAIAKVQGHVDSEMVKSIINYFYMGWMGLAGLILLSAVGLMVAAVVRRIAGWKSHDDELEPPIYRIPLQVYDIAVCVTIAHFALAVGSLIAFVPEITAYLSEDFTAKGDKLENWARRMDKSLARFSTCWGQFRRNLDEVRASHPDNMSTARMKERLEQLHVSLTKLHLSAEKLGNRQVPTSGDAIERSSEETGGSSIGSSTGTGEEAPSVSVAVQLGVSAQRVILKDEGLLGGGSGYTEVDRLVMMWEVVGLLALMATVGLGFVVLARMYRRVALKERNQGLLLVLPMVVYMAYTALCAFTVGAIISMLAKGVKALAGLGVDTYQAMNAHIFNGGHRVAEEFLNVTLAASEGLPMVVDAATDVVNTTTPLLQSFLLTEHTVGNMTEAADELTLIADQTMELDAIMASSNPLPLANQNLPTTNQLPAVPGIP